MLLCLLVNTVTRMFGQMTSIWLLCLGSFIFLFLSHAKQNTDLNANGAFADLITVRTSYFRSLCNASPLTWDQGLADKAEEQILDCNLNYDVCQTVEFFSRTNS